MARTLELRLECGDITRLACDVLALKYAQEFYGVDWAVAQALSKKTTPLDSMRPGIGDHRLVATHGIIAARYALFVGVPELSRFGYPEITEFSKRALNVLCQDAPDVRYLASTIHGPGYGLDDVTAFAAQCMGFLEAVQEGSLPPNLKQIAIVDRNRGRVERLLKAFETTFAPKVGAYRVGRDRVYEIPIPETASMARVTSTRAARRGRQPHAFVAMPFDEAMDDVFRLGVENAVAAAGLLCERTDQEAFTGTILNQILTRIETASIVIGDVTGANPNVYLEIGYALAKGRWCILIAREGQEVHYDLRSHKCLTYKTIVGLGQLLSQELSTGRPSTAYSLAQVGNPGGAASEVFVAIPRTEEMEDVFHFGIQQPMAAAGFKCGRAETGAYPTDHITKLQERITRSRLVIAELTGADPNVYFEVGYAWGRGRPTILVARNEGELHYDVRSHRCLTYKTILGLADVLKRELEGLKAQGIL